MTGVSMAGVLAEHQQWVSSSCGLEDECRCGHELRGDSIEAHQAAVLAAAGFGHIATAIDDKAEQEDS
jgi:hypothetical protein